MPTGYAVNIPVPREFVEFEDSRGLLLGVEIRDRRFWVRYATSEDPNELCLATKRNLPETTH